MADHPFDEARQDLWQRAEAVRTAKLMGGVELDARQPAGFQAPTSEAEVTPPTDTPRWTPSRGREAREEQKRRYRRRRKPYPEAPTPPRPEAGG